MIEEFRDRTGKRVMKPEARRVDNRISVYGIAEKENKILLVKPAWKEEFDLPGGGIEKNEDIYAGLKREFLEETGFSIEILNELPIKTKTERFYADDIDVYFNSKLLFFLVEIIGERNKLLIDTAEIKDIVWIEFNEVENKSIKKSHKDVIKKCCKN